jgi:putative membrane protein
MTASRQAEIPWRGLHPLSLAVNLLPQAWRTARNAWPLLLALVVGGEGLGLRAIDLTLLVTFFVLTVGRTLLHFLTLRYRVADGRFEVKVGLFSRSARVLDPERIQNVEIVQNLFHKLAGLVEVRVETTGDGSSHGLLSALREEEATRLRAELRALVRAQAPERAAEPSEEAPPTLALTPLELAAYGFTRRTVGVVAVLTAIGLELFGRFGPEVAEKAGKAMTPDVLLPLIVLAFAGSWLWSAGAATVRHWGHRLRLSPDELITEEGLFTRRRVEIPRGKVQLLRIDETLLRRLMGYGSLLIETAAIGVGDGRSRASEGLVPMVPQERLAELCRAALPALAVDPWTTPLQPAHPRALWRAIFARTLRAAVVCGALVLASPRWGWAALPLVILAPPMAWLDWRRQGWLVAPGTVIARAGFWLRQTWVISRDKVQSVHLVQGPIMRHHGLGRVVVRVAGAAVALPDMGIREAHALLDLLRPEARCAP